MASSGREFFAPAPLAAVALLALNDHWLKATFHNALTGKLSDVAGCFFLPLFISALLERFTPWALSARLTVGATLTTALFVGVSTSRAVADGVCALLSPWAALLGIHHLRIAADPTDLIALPLIGCAVLYGRSRMSRPSLLNEATTIP